jgi:hypothetical protein
MLIIVDGSGHDPGVFCVPSKWLTRRVQNQFPLISNMRSPASTTLGYKALGYRFIESISISVLLIYSLTVSFEFVVWVQEVFNGASKFVG